MAKGSTAKINVQNKIALAFGSDYIGEVDKKLYVWADDGGERVQIAIAMTCPKVQIDTPDAIDTKAMDHDWSSDTVITKPTPTIKAEVTEEETQRIADMMAKFGL